MNYQKPSEFADYWKLEKGDMTIEKFANDRLSEKDLHKVQAIIANLQKKGLSSSRIIKALQKMNAKLAEKWKAERAYYTQVKRDDTHLVIDASRELDISKYRVVLSPHACPICIAKTNNGKKIFKNSDISKGEGHIPPFHPNCVTGDTLALAPDIKYIMRSNYSGNLVKITLSDGRSLSVTENHMILTPNGFIMAKFLNEGDNVISSSIFQGVMDGDPNNNDSSIPTIENLFNSCIESSSTSATRVPVSPEYLHGDARFCNGNIDIVNIDSFLRDTIQSSISKHVNKDLFASINLTDSLITDGYLSAMFIALGLSSDGIMGSRSISDVIGLGSLAVDNLEGLLDASNYNTRIDKASSNDRSRNIELFSNSVFTDTGIIKVDNIVSVDIYHFDGYVYDLNTSSTLYSSNGLLASNCYCIFLPVD